MVSFLVHYDPAVWIRAPRADRDVDQWSSDITAGIAKAYGFKDKKTLRLVAETMRLFATSAGEVPHRFLRPAGFSRPPIIAALVALADEPPGAVAAAAAQWDPDVAWYDGPTATVLDEVTGLVRHQRTKVAPDGSPVIDVHYHVGVPGLDVMLRALDIDPSEFTLAEKDLDDLARAIDLKAD